ncbi:MAG: hypothetical protein O4859_30545, partial [Trichodesmium sp. St18_bin1]|nr:hypothetical protein [Trichodesmium sp. St18_bin1]
NPWFAQNIHATNFFCSIELICLICWLKIVMIIHVSFCTTCRKFRMWVKSFISFLICRNRCADCYIYPKKN